MNPFATTAASMQGGSCNHDPCAFTRLHLPIQQLRHPHLLLPRGEGRRPEKLKKHLLFPPRFDAGRLPSSAGLRLSPVGDPCGDLNTHHKFRLQQSDILLSPVPSRGDDLNLHACADSTDAKPTWVSPLLLVESAHRAPDPACLNSQVPALHRPALHSFTPYTEANTSLRSPSPVNTVQTSATYYFICPAFSLSRVHLLDITT